MVMCPDMRILASVDVLAAETGGEVVVMDPRSGHYFTFEGVGSDIWRRLSSPIEVAELCDALVRDYDAPEGEIRAATLAFLEEMLEMRLIVLA